MNTQPILIQLLLLLVVSLWSCHASQQNETKTFTICSDSAVTVTALELLCDSSGTFYYGSGGYRNSEYCRPGDKAKLIVYFDIEQQHLDRDLTVTLFSSAPAGSQKVVYNGARLCYLGSLTSINDTKCPSMGTYKIDTWFYYGSYYRDNADESFKYFTPTVRVGFGSPDSKGIFDLGGANTYDCVSGSKEVTVTNNNVGSRREQTPLVKFLACLGVLMVTVGILGLFAWFVLVKKNQGMDCYVEHDLMDGARSKAILMGRTKGLVDF